MYSLLLLLWPAVEQKADVVVYGGTAGGVIAAVAAAREGKSVILLEPGKFLGGMFTAGLGATDTGVRAGIGGYSREVFDRIKIYYTEKYGSKSKQVADCSDGFRFEPHVARNVLENLLTEVKIKPKFGTHIKSVNKSATTITSISLSNGDTYIASIFIDATYEGDLMALAGVNYHVGREGREVYGESLAGVQAFSRYHQFHVAVNGLDDMKRPLSFIYRGEKGKTGQGDKKVQAYNFRLCITDRKDNQIPFAKPDGYNPAEYELLARYLQAAPDRKVGQLMNPIRMPNDKTDTNNNGPFSTDYIGMSWTYPNAAPAERAKIIDDHKRYTQGFLYFLANDPRVPPALQKEMNAWGMSKDEWINNDNWPTQIYVREARRMVGAYVMTQKDLITDRTKDDSVGVGSYNADSHHVQRVLKEDGTVVNEGDFQVPVDPYAISYRCLTPKSEQCDNLLVSVAVSTSHVAYGTVRMEPVFMILGHAAGVAAAMAIDDKIKVQSLHSKKLTEKLIKQKAVLSPIGLPTRVKTVGRIDPTKLLGIVIDDVEAILTGEWKHSSAMGPYVGEGYLHDADADKGKLRARFVPKLKPGKYEIRIFYTSATNRSRKTLVVVSSMKGEKEIRIDQQKKVPTGYVLGVFEFDGAKGYIEVRNDDSDGHVIVDAVQFVPVK